MQLKKKKKVRESPRKGGGEEGRKEGMEGGGVRKGEKEGGKGQERRERTENIRQISITYSWY